MRFSTAVFRQSTSPGHWFTAESRFEYSCDLPRFSKNSQFPRGQWPSEIVFKNLVPFEMLTFSMVKTLSFNPHSDLLTKENCKRQKTLHTASSNKLLTKSVSAESMSLLKFIWPSENLKSAFRIRIFKAKIQQNYRTS
jgi:hypothetical protein